MTPKELKAASETINRIYREARNLCMQHRGWGELAEAVNLAVADEKSHRRRRLGQRMVGNIGKRPPVYIIGQYFALRGFLEPSKQRSFSDRLDFVRGYGAAEACATSINGRKAYAAFCRKHRKTIAALGYAEMQS